MCAQKVGAALRIVIGRYGYKSSFGANKLRGEGEEPTPEERAGF